MSLPASLQGKCYQLIRGVRWGWKLSLLVWMGWNLGQKLAIQCQHGSQDQSKTGASLPFTADVEPAWAGGFQVLIDGYRVSDL